MALYVSNPVQVRAHAIKQVGWNQDNDVVVVLDDGTRFTASAESVFACRRLLCPGDYCVFDAQGNRSFMTREKFERAYRSA